MEYCVSNSKYYQFKHYETAKIFCKMFLYLQIDTFLKSPMKGVVIQTYGAGNMPTNRKDLLEVLAAATKRGILIINITQCATGSVQNLYETGKVIISLLQLTIVDIPLLKINHIKSNIINHFQLYKHYYRSSWYTYIFCVHLLSFLKWNNWDLGKSTPILDKTPQKSVLNIDQIKDCNSLIEICVNK